MYTSMVASWKLTESARWRRLGAAVTAAALSAGAAVLLTGAGAVPSAGLGTDGADHYVGETIEFYAGDPAYTDAPDTVFEFDFDGDGAYEPRRADSTGTHAYAVPGDHTASVKVTYHGAVSTASTTVRVYDAPVVVGSLRPEIVFVGALAAGCLAVFVFALLRFLVRRVKRGAAGTKFLIASAAALAVVSVIGAIGLFPYKPRYWMDYELTTTVLYADSTQQYYVDFPSPDDTSVHMIPDRLAPSMKRGDMATFKCRVEFNLSRFDDDHPCAETGF